MPIRRGKMYYCQALGKGVANYDKDGFEWTFDLAVSPEVLAEMDKEGTKKKPKNKDDDRGDFFSFRKSTLKADGEAAKPIEFVDRTGKEWDRSVAIGNGSVVDVKYMLKDYEYKNKKGVKRTILTVRVVEHIPYEGGNREDFEYDDWSSDD